MKIDGANVRGYETVAFADAFDRYLSPPQEHASTRYPSPPERESEHEGSEVAGRGLVAEGGPDLPFADDPEPEPCANHQCIHQYEEDCNRRCETEEQLVEQVICLRRNKWTRERGGAHVQEQSA